VTARQVVPSRPGRFWRWLPAVAVVVLMGVASSCTNPGVAVTTPYNGKTSRLEPGPTYEVKAAEVSGLGPVLVDGQGITLYLYATDRRGSPSRCYNICAIQWPPLVLPTGVAAPKVGPGIDPKLLGTVPRTDGTTQITYNGWPLYLWPPDHSPGTATGQALTNAGGLWYVVDPTGNAVKTR
jgi:predicted lipoprotein with Yx(FWY)xxD motif